MTFQRFAQTGRTSAPEVSICTRGQVGCNPEREFLLKSFMSAGSRQRKKGHIDSAKSMWPTRFVRTLTAIPTPVELHTTRPQKGPMQLFPQKNNILHSEPRQSRFTSGRALRILFLWAPKMGTG